MQSYKNSISEPWNSKISLKSPIGAAPMGKKVGDIAEAQVPAGTIRMKIESITLD